MAWPNNKIVAYKIKKVDVRELVMRGQMWTLGSASLVFTGFGDRLLSEVKKLAPKDVKIKVRWWGVPVGHGGAGQP